MEEDNMKVKVLLFGEALNIPKTNIGLGVGFISVWVDGNGFTSASNSLGSLGYILLETQTVDIGTIDDERQNMFTHLHGSVVHWNVQTNLFAKDGGIATITMGVPTQKDGAVVEKKIQFVATDCTGVSVVSNALDFSCEMLMLEKQLAQSDSQQILADDVVLAAVDAAPKSGGSADPGAQTPDTADPAAQAVASNDPASQTPSSGDASSQAVASGDPASQTADAAA
jgi:hypothetical protein